MSEIKVGDVVVVADNGDSGNYSGVGRVVNIIDDALDQPWYSVRGGWDGPGGRMFAFSFPASRVQALPARVETLKSTNPKDAIGSDKLPLHLWPETATLMGTLGLLDGMLKYGRNNWRETGVRATIYIDALKRHLNAYAEGEDLDPDSGMPHLAHIGACWAILVDAGAAGKLTDDRNYPGGYRALVEELTPHVKQLKAKHAGKDPKHYTIADA